MTRLREEKRANLKKKKEKGHKVTLNASIMVSRDIIQGIIT
jgi:hypothetical protein